MSKIGDILKRLREENGLTGKEVTEKLKELGIDISAKTLYGYESGRNSTNADMFLALCQIYKCQNIMEVFSDSVDDVLFTNKEWDIIEKYRFITDISPDGAKTVDIVLNREYAIAEQLKQKSNRIKELEATESISKRLWAYYGKIACAGTGFIFDDIPTDTIEAPYIDGADFIIGVSGDSMEPDYHDGEKLYVKKTNHIKYGEVGIFTIRNECFLKEYGKNGLVSKNSKYNNIPGDEDVRLIGKVVGKLQS